ncbi:MAG TPA: hypothetical protein VIM48_01120 [Chthoniobacterales bacterium]
MKRLRDAVAILLLLSAVSLSWCQANHLWSIADWKMPTAYDDAPRSDVIQHLAFIKAASDGNFVPFRSKMIPNLGAPGEANWNDWPIVEELQIFAAGMLGRAVGIFTALNIAVLLAHLLAAVTFYVVTRYWRASVEWAFAGALAYGLAPYLFAQSPHHPLVEWCWHLPLFLVVWRWVSSEPGIAPGSRRFWVGLAIGALTGVQMVYYTAIFCQLVLLGALVMFIRNRAARPLVSALCIIGAAILAFALMNLDTWVYAWQHGSNPGALDRPFKWLEIYGLSVANLFVPPLDHHWALFREFARWHDKAAAQADEGSYLGMVGVAAFLFLIGVSVVAAVRKRADSIPMEAWQVLWLVLCFMSGGFNTIAGLFGFTLLRTGCRFSIVILAISLTFAVERLSVWGSRHRAASFAAAICFVMLVIVDQVPSTPSNKDRQAIAAQVASDRKFVADMEAALPAGSTVFQIPVMDYPESPLGELTAYDHFRPYLYSERLRFSFGTNKGRGDQDWAHELDHVSLDQVVEQVRARGFSAIYINCKAYPGHSEDLLQALQSMTGGKIIRSDAGDLACVRLNQ